MEKHEYINDFFYFVVRPGKEGDKDNLLYCSGINVARFLPMMQGRLGLGSNPIVSGLQLVKYDLCTLAISKGATAKEHYCKTDCAGIAPTKEGWYTEPLLIENAGALLPDEIITFCVRGLVKRISATSLTDHQVPDNLKPEELQKHFEILCKAV